MFLSGAHVRADPSSLQRGRRELLARVAVAKPERIRTCCSWRDIRLSEGRGREGVFMTCMAVVGMDPRIPTFPGRSAGG